jgi:hypothetical protein
MLTSMNQQSLTYQGQKLEFIEVPAVGDGNCGLNAMSLWFIDHLLTLKNQNKTVDLDKMAIQALISELTEIRNIQILKKHQKSYTSSVYNAEIKIASSLQDFINFISRPSVPIDENALIEYIYRHTKTPEEIIALELALAPSFRAMATIAYQKVGADTLHTDDVSKNTIPALDPQTLSEIKHQANDSEATAVEMLSALGRTFNINVVVFHRITKKPMIDPENHHSITAYIHYTPGHYNSLIPASRQQGILEVLSKKSVTKKEKPKKEKFKSVTTEHPSQQPVIAFTDSNEFEEIIREMNQVSANISNLVYNENDKSMQHTTSSSSSFSSKEEIIKEAERSNTLLSAAKAKLVITEDKVDNKLNNLAYSEFAKELLLGNLTLSASSDSSDQALARAWQNEEILLFLHDNINFFKHSDKKTDGKTKVAINIPSAKK